MKKRMVTALLCGLMGQAQAIDLDWNGFLSVVGGQTVNDEVTKSVNGLPAYHSTFIADFPTQGVYDNYLSFRPDTILGLQTDIRIDDRLSITGQLTSAGGDDFKLNVRWAYLTYELNEKLKFRAGRLRQPNFLYSDTADVAYSYHWIRPPTSVYLSIFDAYEGLSALYQNYYNDWDIEWEVLGGQIEAYNFVFQQQQYILKMLTTNLKVSNSDWIFRVVAGRGDSAIDYGYGSDDSDQTSGGDGVPSYYLGAAFKREFSQAFLGGELAYLDVADPFPYEFRIPGYPTLEGEGMNHILAYYFTAGYRYQKFTPHITYEYTRTNQFNNTIGNVTANRIGHAITTGLRWDFYKNIAFKFEYTSRRDKSDAIVKEKYGELLTVDLYSFGFDLVF